MEIKRKHQAYTQKIESRILDHLVKFIYPHFTANQLSFFAFCGAVITAVGYILSGNHLGYLHLCSLGVFFHWFGDSLDGRTARLRGENRPRYGHYLDHMLDAVSVSIIILGIQTSSLTLQSEWSWTLVWFLLIMIHSFLKASVTSRFELSFQRFGPTEARLGLILANLLLFFSRNPLVLIQPIPYTLFDFFGLAINLILAFVLIRNITTSLWGKHRIPD